MSRKGFARFGDTRNSIPKAEENERKKEKVPVGIQRKITVNAKG